MVDWTKVPENPFSVTKANDFTDEEICSFWVDCANDGGFLKLFAPREQMSKMILGGKGSGKTHLLRYFSFPLQVIRARNKEIDLRKQIEDDGYIGIYMKCGALDACKFSGKGQTTEKWNAVFTHYIDLRLAFYVLDIVETLLQDCPDRITTEGIICDRVYDLFDLDVTHPSQNLSELKKFIRELQRNIDVAVNNAAMSRTLEIKITSSPGKLVFDIPYIVKECMPTLLNNTFIYIIDELEIFSKEQQKYINTLVRDRKPPVTFRLGARTYGIRTYSTLASGEENRPGSEYDKILLDEFLRKDKRTYLTFAYHLVESRLQRAYVLEPGRKDLDFFFQTPTKSKYLVKETQFVLRNRSERRYFVRLRKHLLHGIKKQLIYGVEHESDIDRLIDQLRVPDIPLLEKVNILFLYRAISRKENLLSSSEEISKMSKAFLGEQSKAQSKYGREYNHFKSDMYYQLCREYDQPIRYVGLQEFIKLSDGLPRNLLIILKNIYRWAVFSGEKPFHGVPISTKAQERGVLEASSWFFQEAPRGGGQIALDARKGVSRLAELFRELVYSDKPPECSLITFAASLDEIGERIREVIKSAQEFSLLVQKPGLKDKNTGRVNEKYHLNRMLVPRWGLHPACRGSITLNSQELQAIFFPETEDEYTAVKARRVARASFPFGLKSRNKSPHLPLFGETLDD